MWSQTIWIQSLTLYHFLVKYDPGHIFMSCFLHLSKKVGRGGGWVVSQPYNVIISKWSNTYCPKLNDAIHWCHQFHPDMRCLLVTLSLVFFTFYLLMKSGDFFQRWVLSITREEMEKLLQGETLKCNKYIYNFYVYFYLKFKFQI